MGSKQVETGARRLRRARPARLAAALPGIAGAAICLWAGRELVERAALPLPGAVAGLVIYAAAMLLLPPVRRWTQPGAAALTALLGALIVPPFVGLVLFAPVLAAHWQPVAVILIVTTIAAGLATAAVYRALDGRG